MKKIGLFCLILFGISLETFPQDWVLKKEKDGIKVFTKQNSKSPFNLLRAESQIDVSINNMLDLIFDVNSHKLWVYNTVQSILLKKIGPYELLYYGETYAPWPVSNRDLVLHLTAKMDSTSGICKINAISEPFLKPLVPGKIRVPRSVSEWTLIPIGQNKTKVIYTLDIDPGGSIPAWLVNFASIEGPYLSFVKMRALLLR